MRAHPNRTVKVGPVHTQACRSRIKGKLAETEEGRRRLRVAEERRNEDVGKRGQRRLDARDGETAGGGGDPGDHAEPPQAEPDEAEEQHGSNEDMADEHHEERMDIANVAMSLEENEMDKPEVKHLFNELCRLCLLYTSDAADE